MTSTSLLAGCNRRLVVDFGRSWSSNSWCSEWCILVFACQSPSKFCWPASSADTFGRPMCFVHACMLIYKMLVEFLTQVLICVPIFLQYQLNSYHTHACMHACMHRAQILRSMWCIFNNLMCLVLSVKVYTSEWACKITCACDLNWKTVYHLHPIRVLIGISSDAACQTWSSLTARLCPTIDCSEHL